MLARYVGRLLGSLTVFLSRFVDSLTDEGHLFSWSRRSLVLQVTKVTKYVDWACYELDDALDHEDKLIGHMMKVDCWACYEVDDALDHEDKLIGHMMKVDCCLDHENKLIGHMMKVDYEVCYGLDCRLDHEDKLVA